MAIKDQILEDVKTAMKAKDTARVQTLRMLKARIQEQEVAQRGSGGGDAPLSDDQVIEILTKYAKQVRESLESYEKAGRAESAAQSQAELEIVESYLPEALSEEDLEKLAQEAIQEAGAESPKQMGDVMKVLMPRVKGRADGKQVSAVVRRLLS